MVDEDEKQAVRMPEEAADIGCQWQAGETKEARETDFKYSTFLEWAVLHIHSGTVFKTILHGEQVLLKICDLWQHPDYEKEGDCVPRFEGAGYTAGGLFTIATDIVGRPLEDAEIRSIW
ncbi:2391_t:CDS:2 [Paraglomus occultum]|uniref:2391_t:CDS:1 n=1 Tax=Paraglomus occultum TaxID=144539 RepID=A0A9N8VSD4_9GLOM|nr:2391_t:CDS:2 [Paraglomus occultum]